MPSALVAALLGDEDTQNAQAATQHDGRAEAAYKEASDGSAGSDAIEHHGDAGGHDDAQATGGRNQRHGKGLVISVLNHGRDHDGADGRHGSRAGTGDGPEEHTGDDGDDREAAGDVPHSRRA